MKSYLLQVYKNGNTFLKCVDTQLPFHMVLDLERLKITETEIPLEEALDMISRDHVDDTEKDESTLELENAI